MTLLESLAVLNTHYPDWGCCSPDGDADNLTFNGSDRYESLALFEAVAIAEKYARGDTPESVAAAVQVELDAHLAHRAEPLHVDGWQPGGVHLIACNKVSPGRPDDGALAYVHGIYHYASSFSVEREGHGLHVLVRDYVDGGWFGCGMFSRSFRDFRRVTVLPDSPLYRKAERLGVSEYLADYLIPQVKPRD